MEEKKLKVIYAHPSQLSYRWLNNYCLDELKDVFDIEYWDCSSIVYPNFKAPVIPERSYNIIIKNEAEFDERLSKLPKDALKIVDFSATEENMNICRKIARHSNIWIFINCFAAGEVMSLPQKSFIQKLISKDVVKRIERKIKYFVVDKGKNKKKGEEFEASLKYYLITSIKSDKYSLRINHPDYERYRNSIKEPSLFKGERYVVYIDNNFPMHPEIKKREPYLNVDKISPIFYSSLNKFFDRIEEKYKCKVKIAGHPVAVNCDNRFGGREILYDKTVELVKDALAVCIHTSNAFSYVVLFNKPVALLYNSVYTQAKIEYGRLQGEAQRLRLPLVNTDDPLPEQGSVFSRLDKDIADNYKATYLIADPTQTNAQLYTKIFHEIYNDWQNPKH